MYISLLKMQNMKSIIAYADILNINDIEPHCCFCGILYEG